MASTGPGHKQELSNGYDDDDDEWLLSSKEGTSSAGTLKYTLLGWGR